MEIYLERWESWVSHMNNNFLGIDCPIEHETMATLEVERDD